MSDKIILHELYELAKKAYYKGEVPVACIITKDGKIIAKTYNKRIKSNNPLKHAEVIAILKATRKLKNWRLSDCKMYVTLEPCHMCKEIIKETRIPEVCYIINKDKLINYKTNFKQIKNSNSNEFSELLTSFFKELR